VAAAAADTRRIADEQRMTRGKEDTYGNG